MRKLRASAACRGPKTTSRVGDLVAAVFDKAEAYSTDKREISRLATRAVANILRRLPTIELSEATHQIDGLRRYRVTGLGASA